MTTRRQHPSAAPHLLPGLRIVSDYLDRAAQARLLEDIRVVTDRAPPYVPRMPKSGRPLSVRMTNCGPLGWVTDQHGYRYQPHHPETRLPWPPIPELALVAWRDLTQFPQPPQCCLINFYSPASRLGMHQDRDETDFSAPVLSLSLGDTCLFRIGGLTRSAASVTLPLASGDAVVLGGEARLAFHGVDRIIPGSSSLLSGGGRINLTLRRVDPPKRVVPGASARARRRDPADHAPPGS